MPQRRRWERVRRELDASVRIDDRPSISCKTIDVCEGGLGVLCSEELAVGADYQIEVPALTADPLTCTVRWCTSVPSRGANNVGVELTGMTAQQTDDLRDAIDRWKNEDARVTER